VLRLDVDDGSDPAALIRLWSDFSGWDQPSVEVWTERLRRGPHGPALIVVARDEDSDDLVGQLAFLPCPVSVDGRSQQGARTFAAIVHPRRRGLKPSSPLEHPLVAMYLHGAAQLQSAGKHLIYMLPDSSLTRFLEQATAMGLGPYFSVGRLPLWSRPIGGESPQLNPGHAARDVVPSDDALDALWDRARRRHRCVAARGAAALRWKLSILQSAPLAVTRGDELVAFALGRAKGVGQWLVEDLIAVDDEAAEAALAGVLREAATRSAADPRLTKVGILANHDLQPVLGRLGFRRDDYDFLLAVHRLSDELSQAEIAPERWYVTADD
jgi:hypothetical protein